jgi:hypothetical protein
VEQEDEKKEDTLAIRVVSGSSFEADFLNSSLEICPAASSPFASSKREYGHTQNLGEPKKSLPGLAIGWPSALRSNVSSVDSRALHSSCSSLVISIRWNEEGFATVNGLTPVSALRALTDPGWSRRGSQERKLTSLASVFLETKEPIRSMSRSEDRPE